MAFRRQNLWERLKETMMLKITVQKLGDTSVLRCHGRIVAGDAGSILRNAILRQRHTRVLVIDLARVERIDAGGLGVLLGLRELARSSAILFKLMNATKRVEEILELTHLQRVFEFCSVRELFCLLHRAASVPSGSSDQSNRADENDSRNGSLEWPEAVPAV
jgi:anti-sigma B factor antagonist